MRYAFLILEPKRNDASKTVRHVLCSPTDEDRDEWINALLHYVAMDPEPSSATSEKGSRGKRLQRRQDHEGSTESNVAVNTVYPVSSDPLTTEPEIIGIRYDQMPAGKRPMTATDEGRRQSSWPQPSQDDPRIVERLNRSPEQLRQAPPSVPSRSPYRGTISGPLNGAPITDETVWNSAQREEERRKEEKRAKKRSVWGFLSKGRTSLLTVLIDRQSWSIHP
jgi:RalA-binding protein 1